MRLNAQRVSQCAPDAAFCCDTRIMYLVRERGTAPSAKRRFGRGEKRRRRRAGERLVSSGRRPEPAPISVGFFFRGEAMTNF